MLKGALHSLSEDRCPHSYLINTSLNRCVFSSRLKIATLLPIFFSLLYIVRLKDFLIYALSGQGQVRVVKLVYIYLTRWIEDSEIACSVHWVANSLDSRLSYIFSALGFFCSRHQVVKVVCVVKLVYIYLTRWIEGCGV